MGLSSTWYSGIQAIIGLTFFVAVPSGASASEVTVAEEWGMGGRALVLELFGPEVTWPLQYIANYRELVSV